MASMQGMQTVLYSHIRQLQGSPHQFSDKFSSNLKDCTCRGYRDDRVNSQTKQRIISYELRKQRLTRRAHGLRFSQQDPPCLSSRNLLSIGAGRRRESTLGGPVYCLKTSEVETADAKSVSSSVEGKNVDAVKKGLSSLDAYFDKLHASGVEEPSNASEYSQGTANGVLTSSTGSQSSRGAETGNVTTSQVESQEKRSIGGLNALDSYFNKLRPIEPGKVKQMMVLFMLTIY